MPVHLVEVVHLRMCMRSIAPNRKMLKVLDTRPETAVDRSLGCSIDWPHTMFHTAQWLRTLDVLGYQMCSADRLIRPDETDVLSISWKLGPDWSNKPDRLMQRSLLECLDQTLFRFWKSIVPSMKYSPVYGWSLTVELDFPLATPVTNRRGLDGIPITSWCCSAGKEELLHTAAVAKR